MQRAVLAMLAAASIEGFRILMPDRAVKLAPDVHGNTAPTNFITLQVPQRSIALRHPGGGTSWETDAAQFRGCPAVEEASGHTGREARPGKLFDHLFE